MPSRAGRGRGIWWGKPDYLQRVSVPSPALNSWDLLACRRAALMEPILIVVFVSVVAASVFLEVLIFLEVLGWPRSVPVGRPGLAQLGALLGAAACRDMASGHRLKPECCLGAGGRQWCVQGKRRGFSLRPRGRRLGPQEEGGGRGVGISGTLSTGLPALSFQSPPFW